MKLMTHNMLTSKSLKGVKNGFPLKIVANEVKEVNVEFNKEFIERVLQKMDWNVLCSTATQFGVELPQTYSPNETNEEDLKRIHHALIEIEIMDGHLVCPETGHKFPISQGIPNMLCNEDEV